MGTIMRRQLAKGGALLLGIWILWYKLVLVKAMRSNKPWGWRWLAALSSGILNRFGSWWLNFSHNIEDVRAAGVWGQGQQYVLPWHPHGAFTIAALYFLSHFWATDYPTGKPGGQFVIVAPILLKIPFLSEFLLLCHSRLQDSRTFGSLLSTGASVGVAPGGLLEQVETDHTQERIVLPPNVGFIRMAIKHGTPLLPMYAFGENQLYITASWTRRLNSWFYKKYRIGNLLIIGQGGIPSSPILPNPVMLPVFRTGLHIRWSTTPIDVGAPDDNPSEEKVNEVCSRYIAGIQELFDKYKDSCLPKDVADRGLIVEWRGHKGADAHDKLLLSKGQQNVEQLTSKY